MFYRIIDVRDDFAKTAYCKEEAIAIAINHCVIEGLQVVSYSDIEDCPLLIYIDPDDNSTQEIKIFPINV